MNYLDFDQVDWFEVSWRGGEHASIQASSGSWNNLTTTSVDGVSVQGDIIQVESDTANVLI